jgi:tRNA-dihydrouridine synthase A
MSSYLEQLVRRDIPVKNVSRHMLGLFQGQPGARRWRRYISENAHRDPANSRLLLQAFQAMQAAQPVSGRHVA